jgi:hypothetical protein
MKNIILALAILIPVSSSFALETDNYISWDRDLIDSADPINTFIKKEIEIALEKMNNKRRVQSCEAVTMAIAKRFRALPPFKHPLEDWIRENLTSEHVYPHSDHYTQISIYKHPYRFFLRNMPIAPNVNINGNYLNRQALALYFYWATLLSALS